MLVRPKGRVFYQFEKPLLLGAAFFHVVVFGEVQYEEGLGFEMNCRVGW